MSPEWRKSCRNRSGRPTVFRALCQTRFRVLARHHRAAGICLEKPRIRLRSNKPCQVFLERRQDMRRHGEGPGAGGGLRRPDDAGPFHGTHHGAFDPDGPVKEVDIPPLEPEHFPRRSWHQAGRRIARR